MLYWVSVEIEGPDGDVVQLSKPFEADNPDEALTLAVPEAAKCKQQVIAAAVAEHDEAGAEFIRQAKTKVVGVVPIVIED